MEGLSSVLTLYFVSCVHVRFYVYTLLAVPSWLLAFLIFSPPLWIFMFLFLRNSSLLFSITRSSSFFVIHLSVNIKNNVEEDTTLLLFFLSKSSGGHAVSFQINPWVAFELLYLPIELFYICMPVVRTGRWSGGWAGVRPNRPWPPNRLLNFLPHGAPLRTLGSAIRLAPL